MRLVEKPLLIVYINNIYFVETPFAKYLLKIPVLIATN